MTKLPVFLMILVNELSYLKIAAKTKNGKNEIRSV